MLRKLLATGFILVISLVFAFSVVHANTYNGTVQITCTTFTAAGTGADVLDRNNTGSGTETVRIDVVDGAGTVIFTFTFTNALGSYSGGLIPTEPYTTAPKFNPISVRVTSLAGNGLAEVSTVIGTGNCAGLPTFVGTCLPLTANSVVGDMPFQTQAYWAPGKVSPDVFVSPGTYWVLGEDANGQYYEILLSCQYLWVPINSMQPSFQPPWSGQPLPTTNVEG